MTGLPRPTVFAKSAAGAVAGSDDAGVSTGAQVTRWRRYGKDRLYVTASDGTQIGWRDLLTGEDHLEAPDAEGAFIAALATWSAGVEHDICTEVPDRAIRPMPGELAPEPEASAENRDGAGWEDLAEHRPGAMAREQALALKQAAPVRTFVARALSVHTEERAWRVGADGEELVAARLQRLAKKDPRWKFLHAIPVGEKGSDIDHLVVGPGGVFTLNAKHHPRSSVWVRGDTFMVNGQRLPYLRNSRHEAMRAARLLTSACGFPVAVHGVVVPVGVQTLKLKDLPSDVSIVDCRALRGWLRRRATALSDDQILAAYDMARRSTTWC